jgi:hypothetical protein
MTLVISEIDSSKRIIVQNLKSCIVFLSYVVYNLAKAQGFNVNNGFNASQNKAVNFVNLAG